MKQYYILLVVDEFQLEEPPSCLNLTSESSNSSTGGRPVGSSQVDLFEWRLLEASEQCISVCHPRKCVAGSHNF